ncbi:GAF domain-containing protein [Actinoplanes sp. CA-131856]
MARRVVREYERFVELSPDMVVVAGHNGYWKRVSPAVRTVLGYSPAEVLARPYLELVHPDDRELVVRPRPGAASFTCECRMRHQDGSFRLIEWTITSFPGRNERYGIGRDVTDRRRAEREQAAIQRIASLGARVPPRSALFDVIAEEAGRLLDAAETRLSRLTGDRNVTVVGHSGSSSAPLGEELFPAVARSGRAVMSAGATTLAIPVFAEGALWGILTAAAAPGRALPPDAETSLTRFAGVMSTAIAGAESRHALARMAQERAALRRVAMLVAHNAAPGEVFAAVAGEAGTVLGTDISIVACCNGDGTAVVLGSWSTYADSLPVGTRVTLGGHNAVSTVVRTGRPARVASYDGTTTGHPAEIAKREGWKSAIAAPILVEGRTWGMLLIATRRGESFPSGTEERLATFTDLVATAVANTQAHEQLAASRRRIVAAADEARRTIERNLHDGTQQRLVSLALAVRSAQSSLPASLGGLRDELSNVAAGLAAAVGELRELARGIHPAALARGGLSAALRGLAGRSAIPVDVKLALDERPAEPTEAAAYFVVSEALANAVKHSAATRIEVWVEHRDQTLHLSVRDDGAGGADPGGSGLLGLRDRVEALGGSLSVHSPPGRGTRIVADLPFRLDPPRPPA